MDTGSVVGSSALTLFWMLVAVAAVALLTKQIRLPYTVALVIAGLIIAFIPGAPHVVLTPDLILAVFLPTLVFEAAYNLHFRQLWDSVRTISTLAIPGVLLTAAVVGVLTHLAAGLDWPVAFLFGAIVAATDPVSVVATFRELGAPQRLRTIVEGESLFNDGTALVLFRLILGILVAGSFNPAASGGQFVLVIAGGLVLGLATGYVVSRLMARFDDYLVETVLTVILAYGTYFLAEELQVSGVIAVVSAGLVVGNYAQHVSFSATSRIAVGLAWEFLGFLTNSLIFLFVGLQINATRLLESAWNVGVAVVATLLARGVAVVLVIAAMRLRGAEHALPWRWQAVLVWGGLRGALSLAMALSLPFVIGATGQPFAERGQILVMTFGVILFTLLVQGLTIKPLLARLGLVQEDHRRDEYARAQAQLRAARAAQAVLDRQAQSGAMLPDLAADLRAEYARREADSLARLDACHLSDQTLRAQELRATRRRLLAVERSTLRMLYTQGALDEDSWRAVSGEVDGRLAALEQDAEDASADRPAGAGAAPVASGER